MSTTPMDVLDSRENEAGTGYVLPKPGRGGNELVLPAQPSALQRHREAEVCKAIGTRVAALVECQQQFLSELRSCLEDVEDIEHDDHNVGVLSVVKTREEVIEEEAPEAPETEVGEAEEAPADEAAEGEGGGDEE